MIELFMVLCRGQLRSHRVEQTRYADRKDIVPSNPDMQFGKSSVAAAVGFPLAFVTAGVRGKHKHNR